jgi:hypothetical protein
MKILNFEVVNILLATLVFVPSIQIRDRRCGYCFCMTYVILFVCVSKFFIFVNHRLFSLISKLNL